jgi:hypothetical protein
VWCDGAALTCVRDVQRDAVEWNDAGSGYRSHPKHEETYARMRHPQWMCNKPIAANLLPWHAPTRTRVDDVSISVFSGNNIRFSRAVACRDTWMMRFPNSFLMTAEGDPVVPIVGMRDRYPRWFSPGVNPVRVWRVLLSGL